MARSKAKQPALALPPALVRLTALLAGPGRPLVLGVAMLGIFGGIWLYVWREVRPRLFAAPDYRVTARNIEITPLPSWIHCDVRDEAFSSAEPSGSLSLQDDNLTEKIAAAFSLHPWVARVHKVTKRHPARVVVDLEYREPVLMVDTTAGLLPVDVNGVLLPAGDFSPVEKSRFPRLVGIDTAPVGTAGERWGDPRVMGAARVVAAIGLNWQELKLDRIAPSTKPVSNAPDDYVYILLTRGGTQIFWGRAPGGTIPGELSPRDKLARLRQYYAEFGSLDGRNGPQELDIRNIIPRHDAPVP